MTSGFSCRAILGALLSFDMVQIWDFCDHNYSYTLQMQTYTPNYTFQMEYIFLQDHDKTVEL